jgi:Tfp pilus assembly protein PilZ
MERRIFNRLPIKNEITIFTKDGYFTALMENISAGGLFLRTNKNVEVGEMIEISIALPSSPDKKNVNLDIVAVRVMDNGIAFKFQVIDDNAQCALLHLLDSACA